MSKLMRFGTPSPPPLALFRIVLETNVLLGMITSSSDHVKTLVERIPVETTFPSMSSTWIRSPTSNGRSIASKNEFRMLPNVCCKAKPAINENTAIEASSPINSNCNSSKTKYRPRAQTKILENPLTKWLRPVTATP